MSSLVIVSHFCGSYEECVKRLNAAEGGWYNETSSADSRSNFLHILQFG